jgi:hypothetical protein
MKKNYQAPEAEIVKFDTKEIATEFQSFFRRPCSNYNPFNDD